VAISSANKSERKTTTTRAALKIYNEGVCHTPWGLPKFTIKKYLKGKRRIMKIQIFHHAKNITFKKKNPLKENQNPSRLS
jgi:hypothetical protein